MKFTIRNGPTILEFEGELEEFDRLASAVDIPADLLGLARAGRQPAVPGEESPEDDTDEKPLDEGSGVGPLRRIDVRALAERLATLEAKSDIDRVTVMAHAAMEAGLAGIDYGLAENLFVELGERKPTRIRATFQNARARGLVHPAGRGTWAPTVAGENYARLGHKKPRQRASARTMARPNASEEAPEP